MRAIALGGLVLWSAACSDGEAQPCKTDSDCKGDRICGSEGVCVAESENGGGGSGGGAASSQGGAAVDGGGGGGGGGATGGAPSTGGSGGEGGTLVDTCPLPTEAFEVAVAPSPGANVNRRRAALSIPTGEPAGLYTVDYYQNGSFYSETLRRFSLSGDTWQNDTVADEQWGFSFATALDTTSGDDPCIVYSDDYDAVVRLACASISDRIVAPGGASALAVAASGPQKQMVRFEPSSGLLEYFTTDGGTPSIPVAIDEDIWVTALSVAVDANGTPHVAYHAEIAGSPDQLEVRYATLTGGSWQVETVFSETAAPQDQGPGSVSLALDPYGVPSVAYHHLSARSLEIVSRDGGVFGPAVVLDAPQPNFPNDDLGRYVVVQIDCYARKRVIYSRSVSTDPQPDSHLYWGIATPSGLDQRQMVPLLTTFNGWEDDLAYEIDAAGHDHIAIMAGALQYVTR